MKNNHKNNTELSIPTAFALNNIAVSLLTLEGCKTSLETLTDAVALVRSSAAAASTTPDPQVVLQAATTRHRNALFRANAHHGEDDARGVLRHKAQSVLVSPAVTDCDWFALCSTVQPQPASSSSSATALRPCSACRNLTPVSISSAMLDDENGQQDTESFVRKDGHDIDEHDQVLGLGILFYNFGLAHVLAAEPQRDNNNNDAHSNNSCSSTLLSQACHWLQKAELSFATLKDQVSNGWDYETECLARLLQVLTLQALAVVYDRQQQQISSARSVWRRKARECERIAACLLRQHNEAPSPPMRLLLLSAAGRLPRSSAAAA